MERDDANEQLRSECDPEVHGPVLPIIKLPSERGGVRQLTGDSRAFHSFAPLGIGMIKTRDLWAESMRYMFDDQRSLSVGSRLE